MPSRRTLIAGITLAAALPVTVSHRAPDLAPNEARADFDALRNALVETHAGLFRYVPKPELDERFDGHRRQLDRPLSQRAFIAIVSEMLADIRDGHTRLEYDDSTTAALLGRPLFPLRVAVEGSRLVVTSNDTPSDTIIKPGMEIVEINGQSANAVRSIVAPKVAGDAFIETGRRVRLARSFATSYWLFVDTTSEFAIAARDAAGTIVRAKLAGVTSRDRQQNRNPVNALIARQLAALDGATANISLQFHGDSSVARLRVRAFDGGSFQTELEQTIAGAARSHTLLLDLRGNGGGVDLYGALLVSQFVDRPFRYFDRIEVTTIRPSFATWKQSTFDNLRDGTTRNPAGGFLVTPQLHPGVAEQSPARTPFRGRLVVLIDGGTFSTAADVAAVLRHLGRAVFVGEETAGGYLGNTSGLNAEVRLQHSKLRLKIPMYGYWNAVRPVGTGGTLPDHVATRTTADVLAGRDPQVARALSLAQPSSRN